MSSDIKLFFFLPFFFTSLTFSCSKKVELPGVVNAVPADAEIVATADAKPLVAYTKQVIQQTLSAALKDRAPSFDALVEQVLGLTGIDLGQLNRVTYIGYVGSKNKMAFIAEGIDVKSLGGEKQGERNRTPLYVSQHIHYAELAGLGVALAPSDEMLKEVLDAYAGKSKRIGDSDRAELLGELVAKEKDLDQLRIYLLTNKIDPDPRTQAQFAKIKGGGLFLSLDRGISSLAVTDKEGAAALKKNIDLGVLGFQMALATGGGGIGLPVQIDEDTKKLLVEIVSKIKTEQSGTTVSVSYRGDLRPLIEKSLALGLKELAAEPSATASPDTPEKLPGLAPAPAPRAAR